MSLFEKLKDRYTTWHTGKSRDQREWEAWYKVNVVYRAHTIENMFMHFKYIIEVKSDVFFKYHPFVWVPCDDAQQYFWPARRLGENAVWRFVRVTKNIHDGRWHRNEMGGGDHLFVATNSECDAVMIALKYS